MDTSEPLNEWLSDGRTLDLHTMLNTTLQTLVVDVEDLLDPACDNAVCS